MRDFSNPCSVLTKSPLLLRDLDLFRELVERTDFSANLSVPTLDEKVVAPDRAAHAASAHAPGGGGRAHPERDPVERADRAADARDQRLARARSSAILELAGEAGARNVTPIGLHLRGEVREIFFDWLRQYRPDLIERYERLYRRGAYLPRDERKRLGPAGALPRRAA